MVDDIPPRRKHASYQRTLPTQVLSLFRNVLQSGLLSLLAML